MRRLFKMIRKIGIILITITSVLIDIFIDIYIAGTPLRKKLYNEVAAAKVYVAETYGEEMIYKGNFYLITEEVHFIWFIRRMIQISKFRYGLDRMRKP